MKKAFDQTVRDLKREVNKKVLKIPGIEQKVLDATSNEPWGPHGSHLADIAQATRNYHEYQMIMAVIWKRINDTGKNWRHVYKALTVLEYLVAHGSERVIDEIREHAYQISTLSNFQYIDSSGRDQGSNIRKKSQSLVVLVNDKERIQEVRQKAAANRDKFRSASSTGGMYRPSSYSSTGGFDDRYDDDHYESRYGNRDEERNGYGREREREGGYMDDDRYGRGGDSYSQDGDRFGRDSDERYGRDGFRDDDYRGRGRSNDDYPNGSRSRSSDRDKDRAFEDDGHYSSRSSGARADEYSQDGRRLERKFSEQNIGAPPSYEETLSDARSPVQDERVGETAAASFHKASSPPGITSQSQTTSVHNTTASPADQEVDGFDEFDPRGSVSVAPPNASNAGMDLLGSFSESFSSNSLAIVPVGSAATTSEANVHIDSASRPTFVVLSSATTALNQPIEDPFGDSPFKATLSTESIPAQQQTFAPTAYFQPTMSRSSEPLHPSAPKMETLSSFDFEDTFPGITCTPSNVPNVNFPSTSPQFLQPGMLTAHQNIDVLANILPPSGTTASVASPVVFPGPTGPPAQPNGNVVGNFLPQTGSAALAASQAALQAPSGPPAQPSCNVFGNIFPQSGSIAPVASQAALQSPTGSPAQPSSDILGTSVPQMGHTVPIASQAALSASTTKAQPPKDKFEPKSTVWADTLSRGLVNLNISGAKINPLADIGIDFESINRKEKRMEKPAANSVTSTITMGKAMGSGSGIGRVGASVLATPSNPPMVGSGMGMGMGGGAGMGMGMNVPGPGMGMGGYSGGMNQPMGMGMGMGVGMGMRMNMGMGQAVQMRSPTGVPPGPTMSGGYNPMMGYTPQQPYGGYR